MKKRLFLLILASLLLVSGLFVSCSEKKLEFYDDPIKITVTVVYEDGTSKDYSISTKHAILKGALVENNLISGEETKNGYFVKAVDGITADYATDGAWWSFYQNDAMCMEGVDTLVIRDGDVIKIVYSK